MTRILRRSRWWAVVVVLSWAGPAWPQFSDLGVSPRAIGMANAFVSVADDAGAVYYNPAGLGFIRHHELSASYARLLTGLTDGSRIDNGYVSAVFALGGPGTIGVSWSSLNLIDSYKEDQFVVALGRTMGERLSVGVTARLLSKAFAKDDYVVTDPLFTANGFSASGIGLGAGILVKPVDAFAVGLAVANVNSPNLGLGETDSVPISVRGGVSLQLPTLVVAADVSFQAAETVFTVGAERWFMNKTIAVRTGFDLAGSGGLRNLYAGLSYRTSVFEFDYAFVFPFSWIQGTNGTHRAGLTVRFGDVPKTPEDLTLESLGVKFAAADSKLREAYENIARLHGEAEAALRRAEEAETETARHKERVEELKKIVDTIGKRLPKPKRPKHPPKKMYTVKKGDTLKSIAKTFYGAEKFWNLIYKANAGQIKRGRVKPKQVLVIPSRKEKK